MAVQSVITDIKFNFEKRAIEAAKNEVKNLDNEINKLQRDSAALDLNSKEFANVTKRVGELTSQKNKLDQAIKGGLPTIEKQNSGLLGMVRSSGLAQQAIAGLSFGLAVGLVKSTISAAAQLERTARGFRVFGLEMQRATKLTEDLDNLAAVLPFQDDQILDIAKGLLKYNVAAEDVIDVTTQLATIAEATGFSFEALGIIFGRANETGKVFGRDFLQIYKNIPGVVEAITSKTGKSTDQIVKLGKAGKLSFEDFRLGIEAVTSETGKYGKALNSFQGSFEGQQKKLRESIGDLQEAFGKGLLSDATAGTNNLSEAFKRLVPAAEFAGKAVSGFLSSIINLVTLKDDPFNLARFFVIPKDQLERAKGFIVGEYNKLFGDRSLFPPIKRPGAIGEDFAELTDEEKDRIKKLNENIRKFFKEEQEITAKIATALFSTDQLELSREGLDRIAQQNEIIKKAQDQIKDLDEGFKQLKISANEAGKTISQSVVEGLVKAKSQIAREADISLKELFSEVKILEPFPIIAPATFIKFDTEKLKKDASDDLNQKIKDLQTNVNNQQSTLSKTARKPEQKGSFLAKLFGLDKEGEEKFNEQFNTFLSKTFEAADQFAQNEINRSDVLINEAQRRLDALLDIQEGGNADQIRLERERLAKLNEEKEKEIQKQRAFAAIQIATSNAVSAAASIEAITIAFSKGGNIAVGIATSIALLATIAATIAAVQSQFSSVPGFYEGAERVSDKLRMSRPGRDGYNIRVDGRERILTGNQNDKIPSFVKNADIPKLVQLGLTASNSYTIDNTGLVKEQRLTNSLLRQNNKQLKSQKIILKVLNNGDTELRLKRMRG